MNESFERAIQGVVDSGFAVCENFISGSLVKSLRNNLFSRYSDGQFKRAGIGKWNNFQKDLDIRNDYIHWMAQNATDPVENEFQSLINNFIDYLNYTCFTGIKSFEFHYALYPRGSFYKRHIDQFSNDPGRQYTMIFYLNENWQQKDGGQLVLYLKNKTFEIMPKGGTMIFFESQKIEHEVLKSHGDRMSITGWLKNQETKIIL